MTLIPIYIITKTNSKAKVIVSTLRITKIYSNIIMVQTYKLVKRYEIILNK
jgi:hypothetical protein